MKGYKVTRLEIISCLDSKFTDDREMLLYIRTIKNKMPELYNSILSETSYLKEACSLTERIYNIKYNVYEIPTCKNPSCHNNTRFINLFRGYADYCSGACVSKSPEIKSKKEKTCIEVYGCKTNLQCDDTKDKIKKTCLEKYGTEHITQSEEIKDKIKKTNMEKYGVEYTLQAAEVRNKIYETNYQRYGCKSATMTPECQEKVRQTNLRLYGYENAAQSPIFKEKTRQYFIQKYGIDNYKKTDQSKQQMKKTFLEKYNCESILSNTEIRDKIRHTNIERLGCPYPFQNDNVKLKIQKTILNKYGVVHPGQIESVRAINGKKARERFSKLLDQYLINLELEIVSNYKDAHEKIDFRCTKCGHVFTHSWNGVQQGYKCPKCYPRTAGTSKAEKEVGDFIKSFGIDIEENRRNIIPPKEIDIFIPSMNIAIEYNGLYWHSEAVINDSKYHLNKTNLCEENGIRLIHIFEDEWIFKQDIVKNRLKQILNVKQDRKVIYARKCIIKPIPCNLKNQFLDTYHIQGKDISKVYFGAYYENELVSVMTFSHGNISKGSIKKDTIWELNRFCSKDDYIIPGIASKLLKYFQKNYEWQEIFSYADRRWSQGNVYTKLGFEFMHYTSVNYWYIRDFERVHRFNLRKRPDEPKDKTEFELREEEGYVRVYDCGSIKYKMSNPNYQGQLTF